MKKSLSIEGLAVNQGGNLNFNPVEFADTTFQNYAEKIAADYSEIIKHRVLPQLSRPGNLKLRELRVLTCIHFFAIPITPAQIAEILRVDPATISRSVQKLETAKMLKREENNRDRRSIRLLLTPDGRQLTTAYTQAVSEVFKELESHLLYGLSDEEKTTFMNVMIKISRRAEALRALANT